MSLKFKKWVLNIELAILTIASIWVGTELQKYLSYNFGEYSSIYQAIEDLKSENDYLRKQIEQMKDSELFEFQITQNEKNKEHSINLVLSKEGVYDNDPSDLGGETVYGVARSKNPKNEIWVKLDSLKKDLAKRQKCKITQLSESIIAAAIEKDPQFLKIAKKWYESKWNALHLDEIKYWPLADFIFDTAINNGEGYALPMWRRALNSINYKKRLGSDAPSEDGFKTVPTLIKMSNLAYSKNQCRKLIRLMKILRQSRYIDLASNRHKNRKFLNGWLNRISS